MDWIRELDSRTDTKLETDIIHGSFHYRKPCAIVSKHFTYTAVH